MRKVIYQTQTLKIPISCHCAAILIYSKKRLQDTILLIIGFENMRIPRPQVSDSLQIYFFPLWRAGLKVSGFAAEFAG